MEAIRVFRNVIVILQLLQWNQKKPYSNEESAINKVNCCFAFNFIIQQIL